MHVLTTVRCAFFCVAALFLAFPPSVPAAQRLVESPASVRPAAGAPAAPVSLTGVDATPAEIQGIFFNRLDPQFYTGFAPRTQNPKYVYTFLGRGNQLRVTMTLNNRILDNYLPDIALRYKTYKRLIDTGAVALTTNKGFERFETIVLDDRIPELAAKRRAMGAKAWRELSLRMMDLLNPGKVFHIRIDFANRVRDWSGRLVSLKYAKLSKEQKLDLINDILPTRLHVSTLSKQADKRLRDIVLLSVRHRKFRDHASWKHLYLETRALFALVTDNIYPVDGNMLDYYEFTAVYPVGTLFEMAKFDGIEIPLYPCPGRRVLHTHQRTRMVDHISEKGSYGFTPWIPYMHVGPKLHNAFHTLWFNIDNKNTNLIPEEWKTYTGDSRTGKPYRRLWLVSRGPMSHGCTHVNAGHIQEMRQMFPSREEDLAKVVTYRNKSNLFDVFDINGDGTPEVMGVKYYHVYTLRGKKPYKRRAEPNRRDYYAWLYKTGYDYDAMGRVVFAEAKSGKFLGSKAVPGRTYKNIELFEADYLPEPLQFYKPKPIAFIRELRRLGAGYESNLRVLELAGK